MENFNSFFLHSPLLLPGVIFDTIGKLKVVNG